MHHHNDNCFLILVDEEMHGEKGVHPEVETAKRKDKDGEDGENEVGITQTEIDS